MTTKEFEEKQSAMSNEELIELASSQMRELAKTGGKSHTMCVPPNITDTDMVLSELIKRFNRAITWIDRDNELPPIGEKVLAKVKDYELEDVIILEYQGDEIELTYVAYWRRF